MALDMWGCGKQPAIVAVNIFRHRCSCRYI